MAASAPASSVLRFNRICSLTSLIGFVALVWWRSLTPNFVDDFAQYYNAGLIARAGAWDDLYPLPTPDSPHNPGAVADSTVTDGYRRVVAGRGRVDGARFIQSPPNALWCWPLAWLDFDTAYVVWSVFLAICVWGAAVCGARVHAIVAGRESRISGAIVLLMCFSPLAYRAVRNGIMTPVVAVLLGMGVLGALRNGTAKTGLALCAGVLTKYASVALLPVYLLRGRWRALAWAAGFTAAAIVTTLAIEGPGPFAVFAQRIAPTLGRSHEYHSNQSVEAFLWRVLRVPGLGGIWLAAFTTVRLALIGGILALLWRRRREIRQSASIACAAMLALVGWMLLFSPMCWDHYAIYLFPLCGWLAWEAGRSRTVLVVATLSLGLMWMPYTGFARHIVGEPLASHVMWGLLGLWGLGIWHLCRGPSPAAVSGQSTASTTPAALKYPPTKM